MPQLVQLPKVVELVDNLTSENCRYVSTVYLTSGFRQVPLRQKVNSIPHSMLRQDSGTNSKLVRLRRPQFLQGL